MKKEVRRAVIERDDHRCQLDKEYGISGLTGVPCSERLEVHHKTYERQGSERASDLITVCQRCHDVITSGIRAERAKARLHKLKLVPKGIIAKFPPRLGRRKDVQNIEIPSYKRSAADSPQRTGSRPEVGNQSAEGVDPCESSQG